MPEPKVRTFRFTPDVTYQTEILCESSEQGRQYVRDHWGSIIVDSEADDIRGCIVIDMNEDSDPNLGFDYDATGTVVDADDEDGEDEDDDEDGEDDDE